MTVEWFLTSVESHVSLQNDLLSERLPTDRTHKAFFTRVHCKMSLNIPSVCEQYMWHVVHVYSFSPVWILKLRLSVLWVTKHFLHTEHWLGRSLACILEWFVKAHFCVKGTPHVWYRYGFIPVCVLTWLFKFGHVVKNFLYMKNKYPPPVCN